MVWKSSRVASRLSQLTGWHFDSFDRSFANKKRKWREAEENKKRKRKRRKKRQEGGEEIALQKCFQLFSHSAVRQTDRQTAIC